MISKQTSILKLLLLICRTYAIFAQKDLNGNDENGTVLKEVEGSLPRELLSLPHNNPSRTPPCHGHNCHNPSPTLPCLRGDCGCSRNKKVKITHFCILYDSGVDDQHQIQLNGSSYYPTHGFVQLKEGQCHSLPHHVEWHRIGSYRSFSVGTLENVGRPQTDDYSVVLHPNDWYNPTCNPYEIKVAVEHNSWKRHTSCWNFPDPSGCGTCNRCEPNWQHFTQSFQWIIRVEPDDGPDCGGCHHCPGCPPPHTPAPTMYPTAPPSPHPTSYPTFSPTNYPTPDPTPYPTPHPTPYPTPHPTPYPTPHPTPYPTYTNTTPPPTCPSCPPTRKEYYIRNTSTYRYLDNSAGLCQNGNNVHLWSWHGRENQRWHDGPNGTIMSANCPGMVLNIDGMSCDPGANLSLSSYTGASNQLFTWNGYELFNPRCNVALDTSDYGRNVITWIRTKYSHQCWEKIYV